MNDSIRVLMGNTDNINFNINSENQNIDFVSPQVQDQNIDFVTPQSENINVGVNNISDEISMAIQNSGGGFNFQLSETPIATNNYEYLINQPSINSVVLIKNKTSGDLGLQPAGEYADAKITNLEIDALF